MLNYLKKLNGLKMIGDSFADLDFEQDASMLQSIQIVSRSNPLPKQQG